MRRRWPSSWKASVVAAVALGVGGLAAARPPEEDATRPPKEAKPDTAPKVWVKFHKMPDRELPQATLRFGIVLANVDNLAQLVHSKRLTYAPWGQTNNTCVKIDGDEFLFGSPPGRWQEQQGKLGPGQTGLRSVWSYPDPKIKVTQTVEVVRGEQNGAVDTCLVRYDLENKDDKEHTVGLRFLLDTYIGTNDGAPFLVPGERALVETVKDFKGAAQVPAFAQALERMDFAKPGVVAHLQLKGSGGLEDPVRVTLGGWPNPDLRVPGADGHLTKWSVPVVSMKQGAGSDSAATIYWAEKKMPAGGKRAVGFAYGLGNFNADARGELALILAGPFRVGAEMTILALVKGPQNGQTATLKLTKGLELVRGDSTQKVPTPPADSDSKVSPVTWTVRTPAAGVQAFTVALSTGTSLRQGVRINPPSGKEKEGD